MKATLTFDLPEDKSDFVLATRGGDVYWAVWNFDQELRNMLKHGDLPEDIYQVYERARDMLHQHLEARDVSLNMVD